MPDLPNLAKPPRPPSDGHICIVVTMPRCRCGATKLRAYRTGQAIGGNIVRYTRCQACGQKIKLLLQ